MVEQGHTADERDVTAGEIGCYAYCAKAWHLQHVLRVDVTTDTASRREAGIAHHERHGRRVKLLASLGERSSVLVVSLVLIAAAALIAALVLR